MKHCAPVIRDYALNIKSCEEDLGVYVPSVIPHLPGCITNKITQWESGPDPESEMGVTFRLNKTDNVFPKHA
ncbi:hypothetical protein Q8A67_021316 [Cirrhinus molitorella]|uniref:Uncharacterized protein n=1 Tax=Cirrhinus molitorella TaxID=172907 RepID=A0AA88P6N4_9TELE|nr:hypothetical protein Q8A67_021316 [Cirrhinus molitorella]